MPIREILLPEFDQEMAQTRKMLERVPDGRFDFTPHAKSKRIDWLAGHVADLPTWIGHTMHTELLAIEPGQYKAFEPKNNAELLERFDKNVREAREELSKVEDDQLKVIWTMQFQGEKVMSMPRYNVLRQVILNHLIHHRAQLSMYLRMMNVAVPGMYGPSADEQGFAKAETETAA
jgi:uncharacterized damage-inducible protein DinB